MIVADSDVLIDALRGRADARGRIQTELETGRLATTVISVFELLSGTRSERQRRKVETLLAALRILPLDEAAARVSGELRQTLESRGEGLATADSLIAGICLVQSAILLTRNTRHFARVPGLVLGRLDLAGQPQ